MTPFSAPSTHTHTSVLYWSKGSPCKQWCSLSLCVFCHANLSMFLYTAGGALRHTLSRSHTHRHTHTQTHAQTHTHTHTHTHRHTHTHTHTPSPQCRLYGLPHTGVRGHSLIFVDIGGLQFRRIDTLTQRNMFHCL